MSSNNFEDLERRIGTLERQRDALLKAAKAVLALPLDWIVDPDGEAFHALESAVKETEA